MNREQSIPAALGAQAPSHGSAAGHTMRILHVLDHSLPLHSGYTFRTLAILRGQRALGWQTLHLTSPKHLAEVMEEEIDGWHFHRTPAPSSPLSAIPLAKELRLMAGTARRIEEIVRRDHPDVIHAHSPVLNAIPALRVGRRFGIPVVYEVRALWEDAAVDHGTARDGGLRYRLSRALETYALREANAVTTICEGLRSEIAGRGIATEKVTVVPNGVDVEVFTRGGTPQRALREQLGLTECHVLGFIGSFYAYEGLSLLVAALPRMLAADERIRLLLVGGGVQELALRALAASLGIAKKVIFTGRVPHAAVRDYYDLVDVLVYPRLPVRLTELVTPLKPLEAMAQGALLAASNVGGHRELIRDNETGVLFAAGDAEALVKCVLRLLSEPSRWPRMRSAARRFVETERSWTRSVARYRQVYRNVLRSGALPQ